MAVAGAEGVKPLRPKKAPHHRDCYGPGIHTYTPPCCSLSWKLPLLVVDGLNNTGRDRVSHCNAFEVFGNHNIASWRAMGFWPSTVQPTAKHVPKISCRARNTSLRVTFAWARKRTSKANRLLCRALELLCQALVAHLAANVLPGKLGSESPASQV